jgi:hypothetical protein
MSWNQYNPRLMFVIELENAKLMASNAEVKAFSCCEDAVKAKSRLALTETEN